MNRTLATLAALVSVVVVLLISQYQPYRYVDAGGPRLRTFIAGSGGPAVVFENGLGPRLEIMHRVQDAVSRFTTTVAYDRAGVGGSEDGPAPRDGRQVALELRTMLGNAGIAPPYVLVGHSLGGLYVRIYASLYPEDVAALVLVDPTRHDEVDPATLATLENAEHPELRAAPATTRQAKDALIPAHIPVYLISAMGARGMPYITADDAEERQRFEAARLDDLDAHKRWIDGLARGTLIVTENSGHIVTVEEPALVVETIRQAIAAFNGGAALSP